MTRCFWTAHSGGSVSVTMVAIVRWTFQLGTSIVKQGHVDARLIFVDHAHSLCHCRPFRETTGQCEESCSVQISPRLPKSGRTVTAVVNRCQPSCSRTAGCVRSVHSVVLGPVSCDSEHALFELDGLVPVAPTQRAERHDLPSATRGADLFGHLCLTNRAG